MKAKSTVPARRSGTKSLARPGNRKTLLTKNASKAAHSAIAPAARKAPQLDAALLNHLCAQLIGSTGLLKADPLLYETQKAAIGAAFRGIAPRDALEGMMATQLIAGHDAIMEAYRRVHSQLCPEGISDNLRQAAKLTRSFGLLVETLNRHRGNGSQQKVVVEHVHVHAGGQAIVGSVEAGRGGDAQIPEERPHAVSHSSISPVRGSDETRQLLPSPGDAERPVPHARRAVDRRAKGQQERTKAREILS